MAGHQESHDNTIDHLLGLEQDRGNRGDGKTWERGEVGA